MESFFAGACTWQKILLSLQGKPFIKKGLRPFLIILYYILFSRKKQPGKNLRLPPMQNQKNKVKYNQV
ncbi:MAG: hypothetical protein KH585_06600 [Oscillibacter sp.]|nr:hypothetical protein [Oscillibacter sp.]